MKNNIIAFIVGFIFAIGLCLAGMTQTQKIIGFLDVFGNWDPSLIFVMIGAIGIHFIAYRLIIKRSAPLFSNQWYIPNKKEITVRLVVGSLLFGIGWGLGGYCPGPAVVSLASLQLSPVIFVASMIGGMIIFRVLFRKVTE